MYRPKPRHSFPALIILASSMLVACLWPLDFFPPNDVAIVPSERSLRFQGNGTAYSREPFPSLAQLSERSELTIDLIIKPKRILNSSVPSILSFCAEEGPPALVIGAWKRSLVIRLGRPDRPDWRRYHEIGVDEVFAPGRTVHLVISLSPRGTTLVVDDRLIRSFPAALLDTYDSALGRLLLGNSPTGGGLWTGDILGLALYDYALTPGEMAPLAGRLIAHYRFDKPQGTHIPNTSRPRYDIVMPTSFTPLRRTILESPRADAQRTLPFITDVVLNVIGFMPFGFLAILHLGTSTVVSPRWQSPVAVLSGFTLSLGIELMQAFLPTRSSSLMDLAANTLGSALGVLLFFVAVGWMSQKVDEADLRRRGFRKVNAL